MRVLEPLQNFSMKPAQWISDQEIDTENASTCTSVKARLMAAVQLIISLVALPIILLVGLVQAAVNSKNDEGRKTLKDMVDCLKWHVLFAIPSAAVGIFASLEKTEEIAGNLLDNFKRSVEQDDEEGEEEPFVPMKAAPTVQEKFEPGRLYEPGEIEI